MIDVHKLTSTKKEIISTSQTWLPKSQKDNLTVKPKPTHHLSYPLMQTSIALPKYEKTLHVPMVGRENPNETASHNVPNYLESIEKTQVARRLVTSPRYKHLPSKPLESIKKTKEARRLFTSPRYKHLPP